MAKQTNGTVRGNPQDRPLTHEERRRVIEAPWPVVNLWAGKGWGGVSTNRLLLYHTAKPWFRKEDASDD